MRIVPSRENLFFGALALKTLLALLALAAPLGAQANRPGDNGSYRRPSFRLPDEAAGIDEIV